MANLPETPDYPAGVYQLETSDPVLGGPGGIANRQAEQLGNRTAWLKDKVDAFLASTVAVFKATRLATARTLSISGAGSGSASFDGSANANIALTLADSGAVAGTYPKVTVSAKGLVTGGSALVDADIPASLALAGRPTAPTAEVGTSTTQVANTEFVTEAMTALRGKTQFTANGIFTVPPSVTRVFVTVIGGGGGGGSGGRDLAGVQIPGGGGGAGQYQRQVPVSVSPGQQIGVTVGTGGQGAAFILEARNAPLPSGGTGGISSFGPYVTCAGGSGGDGGFAGSGSVGGAGGGGWPGGSGGEYTPNTVYAMRGGAGASSPLGGGGPSLHGYQSPAHAGGYGAGGGGGALYYMDGVGDANGGNGSPGICIVEW